MSMVKMVAIEPCDSHHPGEEFEVPERQASQYETKGLAKRAAGHANKMATPVENKASPSPAAGGAAQPSASPAAPASPRKTVTASTRGGTAPRKRAGLSR